MAISKMLTVNIKEDKAKATEKMFVYKNDSGIDMYIELNNLKYGFGDTADVNNIDIAYVSASFRTPSDVVHTINGLPIINRRIKFSFTKELVSIMQEVGDYELQFQLFDRQTNRLTIPSYFFTVKEPLGNAILEILEGMVDYTHTDFCTVAIEEEPILFAIENGYIKTEWRSGDLITASRLNNIEDGIEGVFSLTEYKSNDPSLVAVGGLPVGFTAPNGISVPQLIYEMLHPYQAPTISLSITPNTRMYELGNTISTLTLNTTATKKSQPLYEIGIFKNGVNIKKEIFGTPLQTNYTLSHNDVNISSNCSYYSYVRDASKSVSSSSIALEFINPIYIGSVLASVSSPTQTDIKAMTKLIVKPSAQTFNYSITNRRMCIAVPTDWNISSIIDPNGFNITPSFAMLTTSITCLDGISRTYKTYVSEPTSQSNFTVRFNI